MSTYHLPITPALSAPGTLVTPGGRPMQPLSLARRFVARLMLALDVAKERRQLAALDPRLLKDIGLSESTAYRETRRSLFDVPVARDGHAGWEGWSR